MGWETLIIYLLALAFFYDAMGNFPFATELELSHPVQTAATLLMCTLWPIYVIGWLVVITVNWVRRHV